MPDAKALIESDPVLSFWRKQVDELGAQLKAARAQPKDNDPRHIKMLEERRRQYAELEAGKREELMTLLREREKNAERNSPAGRWQQAAERVEQIKQRRLIAGLDKMAARAKPRREP